MPTGGGDWLMKRNRLLDPNLSRLQSVRADRRASSAMPEQRHRNQDASSCSNMLRSYPGGFDLQFKKKEKNRCAGAF